MSILNSSKPDRNFWTLVIIAVTCGIFAGVFGEIIAKVYISSDIYSPFSSEINLANLNTSNAGLVIRNAQKVVVNQDVKTTETINNIKPGLVGIFKTIGLDKATSSLIKSAENNRPSDYYKLDQPLFIGLIITSDGWVVALAPSELKTDFKFKDYVVIKSDRQIYKIDQVADFKKLPGDLLVFHLAGAANLPIKKIVARTDLSLGQSLLIVNGINTVWPTTLISLVKMPAVLSSDALNVNLNIADGTNVNFKNSFVFNLAGDLTAIITANQEIVPAFSYKDSWSALSQKIIVPRPFLGVNYLDLSLVETATLRLNQGAWLYPTATQPAVIKNSPAELAGLQAGDVITWINNQVIDANNDLADLLSTYKAGDTITLTYWRAGAEKFADIKLGELK
ncbi:MAG: PDZ domain-containing protein [Patescibacteria group bacterium]|jgi:hypothetical protein